jgi:hypothetical protein
MTDRIRPFQTGKTADGEEFIVDYGTTAEATVEQLRKVNARQAETIDRLARAERAAIRRAGALRERVRELERELEAWNHERSRVA